jgi:hypothetical protein
MKKTLGAIISGLVLSTIAISVYRALKSGRMSLPGRGGEFSKLLDLNSCTLDQLNTLPGIRSEFVDRIIENRPYRNKLDLVSRMVVPQAEYEQISHLIVVSNPNEPVKVA